MSFFKSAVSVCREKLNLLHFFFSGMLVKKKLTRKYMDAGNEFTPSSVQHKHIERVFSTKTISGRQKIPMVM